MQKVKGYQNRCCSPNLTTFCFPKKYFDFVFFFFFLASHNLEILIKTNNYRGKNIKEALKKDKVFNLGERTIVLRERIKYQKIILGAINGFDQEESRGKW